MDKVWLLWQNDMVLKVFSGDAYEKATKAFHDRIKEIDQQMSPTSWFSFFSKDRPDVWKIHAYKDGTMHAYCSRIARLALLSEPVIQ